MQITLRPFGTQAARVPSPQKQASLLHSLHMLCAPTLATCQFPPPAALKSPNQSTPVFILHCHGLASQRLVCMLHCLGLTSQWPVCMLRPHGHATWCACCTVTGSHHSGQCACCAPMGTQHGVHAALPRARKCPSAPLGSGCRVTCAFNICLVKGYVSADDAAAVPGTCWATMAMCVVVV